MSEWKLKRFWTDVAVAEKHDGFCITLDGRPVRTPAKADLLLPTQGLAEALAAEWRAQEDEVDPAAMPYTRGANSAIDRVTPQREQVADLLADYADSDLVCYRAEHPAELVAHQAASWDPVLDWAATALDARLEPRVGVMHQPQPAAAVRLLRARVHRFGPFHLAAFHDLVGLSGSLLLGFAAAGDWREIDEIWDLSRVDEDWQASQWGVDADAAAEAEKKRGEFLQAKRFFALSGESEAL